LISEYVKSISGKDVVTSEYYSNKKSIYYQYINPYYFKEVGTIPKYTRFSNSKSMDTCYQSYLVETDQWQDGGEWGLTEPNETAFIKNVAKFQKAEPLQHDEDAWKFAEMCLFRQFFADLHDSGLEDAKSSVARLDTATSPGSPWNDKYKTKGELLIDLDFPEFCTRQFNNELLNPNFYWLTSTALKEEIRLLEKLRLDKIRAFTPTAADMNVLTNMLCGKFNDKFTGAYGRTWSGVGINPFQGGWNRLRERLMRHPNCAEGDYSDFDSSLGPQLMLMVMRFRFTCLPQSDKTEANWLRFLNLYKNLIWSVLVLNNGVLVQKPSGNPSGSANTVVDNTLINFFSFAYCWFLSAPTKYRTYNKFVKHVEAALYGDDNTFCVSNKAKDFFTLSSITNNMKKLGLTINFESDEYGTIDDVSFLQSDFNTFILHICVYHLRPDKVYESLKWTEYPNDPSMSLIRAIGVYNVIWSDMKTRAFVKGYILWLLHKYDTLYSSVKEWREGKASFKSDFEMLSFYTGLECKDQKDASNSNYDHLDPSSLRQIPQGRKRKGRTTTTTTTTSQRARKRRNPARSVVRQETTTTRRAKTQKKKKNNRNTRVGASNARISMQTAPLNVGTKVKMNKKHEPTIVNHSEYIGAITTSSGSGQFTIARYAVQPGIFATFPWLYNLTRNFDMYSFKKLRFRFVPMKSASTDGTLYMAWDPNSGDDTPQVPWELMNYEIAIQSSVWEMTFIDIPARSRFAKNLFLRQEDNWDPYTQTDIKTYDLGAFFIASSGVTATSTQIGSLYVDYTIHLLFPQTISENPYPVSSVNWSWSTVNWTRANFWDPSDWDNVYGATAMLPMSSNNGGTTDYRLTPSLAGFYIFCGFISLSSISSRTGYPDIACAKSQFTYQIVSSGFTQYAFFMALDWRDLTSTGNYVVFNSDFVAAVTLNTANFVLCRANWNGTELSEMQRLMKVLMDKGFIGDTDVAQIQTPLTRTHSIPSYKVSHDAVNTSFNSRNVRKQFQNDDIEEIQENIVRGLSNMQKASTSPLLEMKRDIPSKDQRKKVKVHIEEKVDTHMAQEDSVDAESDRPKPTKLTRVQSDPQVKTNAGLGGTRTTLNLIRQRKIDDQGIYPLDDSDSE